MDAPSVVVQPQPAGNLGATSEETSETHLEAEAGAEEEREDEDDD